MNKMEKKEKFVPRDRLEYTRSWGIFGRLDSMVFILAAVICFGFILWGAIDMESLNSSMNQILSSITANWKWMYLGGSFSFVVFCFFIAFSKYGKIRFGKDTDVPEYSNFSWFAMLFGAGMGVGLVYWSVGEPIYHFLNGPTYAGDPGSVHAAEWSMAVSYLHWGITPWAIYVMLGIPLGLVIFKKGMPALISSCFYPLLGEKIYGPIGKFIDVFTLCITFFGTCVSVGMGVMQLGAGISFNYGVQMNNTVYIIILVIVTAAYLASACLPIDRGIKVGSNVSMIACIGLLLFVFVLGPTRYILDNLVNSVGIYIQNFISMSLWTDPVGNTGWLDSWTVFYWAWWISWAPFVAMFIAKISKGRTIKEFVMASVIAPTIFDIVFFSIFGSTALSIETNPATKGIIESAINAEVGNGIFVLLNQFPLSKIMAPVMLFVVFTFFVVSADSATIVLGMLSSGGDDSPRTSLKILWGVAMALCSAILIFMGGLDAIQTIAIIAVFPFIFIMFFLFYNTMKMVKEE